MADFRVGQNVELHPCTDRWMMGDRFGIVRSLDKEKGFVKVKLNISGKTFNFLPRNILKKRRRLTAGVV